MIIRNWPLWLGLAIGLGALAAGLVAISSPLEDWQLAARWTARAGFPLLILTYVASSLAALLPGDATRALLRDRRWWGLGFAACHTVHLAALATYLNLSGEGRPLVTLVGGGAAYALLYLMVLTSSHRTQRALGANWKRLHTAGIHWLWFIFLFSYLGRTMKPETMLEGIIGTAVALGALALRIAAAAKRRRRRAGLA